MNWLSLSTPAWKSAEKPEFEFEEEELELFEFELLEELELLEFELAFDATLLFPLDRLAIPLTLSVESSSCSCAAWSAEIPCKVITEAC